MEAKNETTEVKANCSSIDCEAVSVEKFCRICFEVETNEVPTISPCECNGSMKYIHEECLKKWILTRTDNPSTFICDICKSPLEMEMDSKLAFSCSQMKNELFKIIVFPIVIIVITTIIVLIFIYLCNPKNTSKISTGAKVYLAIVMTTCFSIDSALIVMLYKSFKIGCFQYRVLSWKILNSKHKEINTTEIIEIREQLDEIIEGVNSFSYFDESFNKLNNSSNAKIYPASLSERIIRSVQQNDLTVEETNQ